MILFSGDCISVHVEYDEHTDEGTLHTNYHRLTSHMLFLPLTSPASSSGTSRSGSHSFEGPVSIPPRVLTLTPSNVTVRRGQPVRLNVSFTGSPAPVVKWFLAKTELTSSEDLSLCVYLSLCVCVFLSLHSISLSLSLSLRSIFSLCLCLSLCALHFSLSVCLSVSVCLSLSLCTPFLSLSLSLSVCRGGVVMFGSLNSLVCAWLMRWAGKIK